MTTAIEHIKDEIEDLAHEEVEVLFRHLLHRWAFLQLNPVVKDIEAIAALLEFTEEKIARISPKEKAQLAKHLEVGEALRSLIQMKPCPRCRIRLLRSDHAE